MTVLLFVVLLILDQGTKLWAERALSERPFVLLDGIFEFRYLENRGAAFGILQNGRFFFIVLAVVVLLLMGWVFRRVPKTKAYRLFRLLLCLLAAGAVGNLIDRVFLSYVRDFLYFSLIDFPIFNVADIYVVVSVFAFMILYFFVWPSDYFDFLSKGNTHG